MAMKRVMVFSPHPDDAEIGMGGTIARLLDNGWEVVVADITNGEPTPAGNEAIRTAETARANKVLGIKQRVCLGLPNRYLQANLDARKVVAEAIRRFQPDWIFANMRPDAHPDHLHATQLVEEARFAAKLTKTDMAHEPYYAEKLFYFPLSHLRVHASPSFVLDVTEQWERKVAAIEAYQSQFWLNQKDPAKQGWIIDYVTSLCRYFGSRIGVKYGEPFFCDELIGLGDLGSLL